MPVSVRAIGNFGWHNTSYRLLTLQSNQQMRSAMPTTQMITQTPFFCQFSPLAPERTRLLTRSRRRQLIRSNSIHFHIDAHPLDRCFRPQLNPSRGDGKRLYAHVPDQRQRHDRHQPRASLSGSAGQAPCLRY